MTGSGQTISMSGTDGIGEVESGVGVEPEAVEAKGADGVLGGGLPVGG